MTNNHLSTITGYGYDGEGVCKLDGKVCFVPFTLEGEEVEFAIEKQTSSFCRGKLSEVNVQSEKREEPPCKYFGVCGGCAYQHTSYENELAIKKELFCRQLKKAGFESEVDVHKSEQRFAYRNKIKLFVSNNKVGLKERFSNRVVDIQNCMLVSERINDVIFKIRNFLDGQKLYPHFDEITIREEDGQVLIIFSKKTKKAVNYQGLYLLIGRNCGIFETENRFTRHVLGLEFIRTIEHGLECEFGVKSFHQVNKYVAPTLYEEVLKNVQGDKVINCYSGAGVLSGIILSKCKKVVGIEMGNNEHADAEKLKEKNSLKNLINIHGDCAIALPGIDEEFDTIVVDPPRAGIDKRVAQSINEFDAKRVIYVSCDSATMARDAAALTNYQIKKAILFDMFACTGEYECMIVLDKKQQNCL